MSKKGPNKGNMTFKFNTLTSEQKQKVTDLYEQFPECDKSNIAIVLDYCQFDFDKANNLLMSDGGLTALTQWNANQSNQIKVPSKSKNKKKKRKNDNSSVANLGTDADDSSSLHSSNIDFDADKESTPKNRDCDVTVTTVPEPSSCSNLVSSSTSDENSRSEAAEKDVSGSSSRVDVSNNIEESSVAVRDKHPIAKSDSQELTSDKRSATSSPREKHETSKSSAQKPVPRQRHGSSHHSKTSTSEDTSANQASNRPAKGGLARCQKDLQRQNFSLQRVQSVLQQHLDESCRKLKNAFAEAHTTLDERQLEMEQELKKVEDDALSLLKSRQTRSAELKRRCDRSTSLSDQEWNDLKSDIKQFVIERKYDDELGKTVWFEWSDSLVEAIKKFGEVMPVKNPYSQRNSHSRSSPSPNSSNAEASSTIEETTVPALRAESGDKSENVASRETSVPKDAPYKSNPHQDGNRRSTVYFNSKNPPGRGANRNNRGRRFPGHRGGHMGGNNYHYHNTENYRQYNHMDYRPPFPHQNRGYHQNRYPMHDQNRPGEPHMNPSAGDHMNPGHRYNNQREHQGHYRGNRRAFAGNKPFDGHRSRGGGPPPANHPNEANPPTVAADKNANYNNEPLDAKGLPNGYP